jgi:hypothetical protein
MVDTSQEGKKTEVLSRIERLRELIEEDESGEMLDRTSREIGRSLDGLMRHGRDEGGSSIVAAEGQSSPDL